MKRRRCEEEEEEGVMREVEEEEEECVMPWRRRRRVLGLGCDALEIASRRGKHDVSGVAFRVPHIGRLLHHHRAPLRRMGVTVCEEMTK